MKVYDEVEVLAFPDFSVLVNKLNGDTAVVENDYLLTDEEKPKMLDENQLNKKIEFPSSYDHSMFRVIYISLHTSSKCNLQCKYCFKKKRDNRDLTFEESKKFIDLIIEEYPNSGKYIVDPTGSGEPLLNKELVLQIGEYCKIKSNEIKKKYCRC